MMMHADIGMNDNMLSDSLVTSTNMNMVNLKNINNDNFGGITVNDYTICFRQLGLIAIMGEIGRENHYSWCVIQSCLKLVWKLTIFKEHSICIRNLNVKGTLKPRSYSAVRGGHHSRMIYYLNVHDAE